MDRRDRRHVPSTEGLEGRQMLSTAAPQVASTVANPYATAAAGVQLEGGANLQQTIAAKRQHIANLPFFLGALERDGIVPQPTVQNIQNDLYSFVGTLHKGNSHSAAAFNLDLRKAQPYQTIRPEDNARLNRDFGRVLVDAGVRPEVAADLQAQLNQLVNYNTQPGATRNGSSITATNDYAIILQLAIGSGRPLVYPDAPGLFGSDHNGNRGKVAITHSDRPSLTGHYVEGTNVQIVDANNQTVLGTGAVNKNGVYQVAFADKLANGTYTVRVRAEESGVVSEPSQKITFIVDHQPPKVKIR